ncbi:MAG: hypothetical protein P9F75_12150 [Candidatus Contendobacter sp.]|nr:hypothetical protein [Candidatus Contendobacter sp.]
MHPKRLPSPCHEPTLEGLLRAMVFGLLVAGFIALAHGAETSRPLLPDAETDAMLAAEINAFSRDLERLRRFMGAPRANDLDIGIHDLMPRDLYFQTLTLWEQTDRLSFEILRTRAKPLPTPTGAIGPQDALRRLQDAHEHVRHIMRQLQITDIGGSVEGDGMATLDRFNALLNLNRQLNLLLERHISPSDVYQQVTLAIGYSARLLARYPDAIRIPEEPPFEPDKLPRDVYVRLSECLQGIVRIFDRLGLAVLKIDTRQIDLDRLQPGDVYLIATLIVSQLNFLHTHLGITQPPPQPIYPGLKFPAHTYQRAAILQAQLNQLERFLTPGQAMAPSPASP